MKSLSMSLDNEASLRWEDAKAEAIALAEAHLAAIAFIEEHLFEPMSVKSIAASSGLSPSRFSRGFTRLQGESVMAYVRGRRLEGMFNPGAALYGAGGVGRGHRGLQPRRGELAASLAPGESDGAAKPRAIVTFISVLPLIHCA